jgi:hypothetical protein
MRSFSVRGQFMLALVGLNVTAIGLIASFAYRASRESLIAQAVSTAHIVADGREQALTRALERQHDRIRAFVGSVESLCGESVTYRALDFENECVRVALRGFRSAERAAAVELRFLDLGQKGSRFRRGTSSWRPSRLAKPAMSIRCKSVTGPPS